MIQEAAAAEKDQALEGSNEIKGLVEGGDLGRAVRRLLDYARDFTTGRRLENDAVALSHRFHASRTEIRRHGSTAETRWDCRSRLSRRRQSGQSGVVQSRRFPGRCRVWLRRRPSVEDRWNRFAGDVGRPKLDVGA